MTEIQILGATADLIMEAAGALAADDFERLDQIEAELIERSEQPKNDIWAAVKAMAGR